MIGSKPRPQLAEAYQPSCDAKDHLLFGQDTRHPFLFGKQLLLVGRDVLIVEPVAQWITPSSYLLQLGLKFLSVTLKIGSPFCYFTLTRRALSVMPLLAGCDFVIELLRPSMQLQHEVLGLLAEWSVRSQ